MALKKARVTRGLFAIPAPARAGSLMPGDTAPPFARLSATVRGRVQGVNFRQSAVREADRLGLTGWVMNRDDGAVETVAEGPRPALERYATWLAKGPPSAWVSRLETRWSEGSGEFQDFTLRWM